MVSGRHLSSLVPVFVQSHHALRLVTKLPHESQIFVQVMVALITYQRDALSVSIWQEFLITNTLKAFFQGRAFFFVIWHLTRQTFSFPRSANYPAVICGVQCFDFF